MPPTRLTYKEIADDLEARIAAGEYPPGTQLPSYAKLGEIYSVSVTTVQSALRLLRERGLTRSEIGRGTYVVEKDDR
jgi:GntR family transcriptional regulator